MDSISDNSLSSRSGFILTRQWRDTPAGVSLDLWLATAQGPQQISVNAGESVCFVLRRESEKALESIQTLGIKDVRSERVELKNYKNLAVNALYFYRQRDMQKASERLKQQGIGVWESDIRPPDRYLMERYITGGVDFIGADTQGAMLCNPKLTASDYRPALSLMSVDIETSMDGRKLYSIGCYGVNSVGAVVSKVFMVGSFIAADNTDVPVEYVSSEKRCLQQFLYFVEQQDPDIFIGWNVIQFDLWLLEKFCKAHRLSFSLGRHRQTPHWREDVSSDRRFISIPGRVALDGIDLLKTAFYNFQSFALNNVAAELLGEGKLIHGSDRGAEITELFHKNKLQLARYNLKDCELVWRIFEKTNLLDFAIERSQLTGMKLDRLGGSAASFDYAYLPRLHRAGYVAPTLGDLQSDIVSPGGFVMDSTPGLYRNVLVLDFKSLYPSIIRTFKIDPAGFWMAEGQQLNGSQVVPGFHGARFAKKGHLLPEIITELWKERDRAKCEKNSPLSQAIKIIMNSFYGVLGSPVCRFFDPRVASSITLRGHEILQTTKSWIEEQGLEVIYGDTDSVFVWLNQECSIASAMQTGADLAEQLNLRWQQNIQSRFGVESALELEFETLYRRFLMPTIRGSEEGSKKRYAGTIEHNGEIELVFKGLETVRTDWTDLAKNFQRELYRRIFSDESFEDYIRQQVADLLTGKLDHTLVYRKRLRRHLHEYKRNIPPQVQAAKIRVLQSGADIRRGDWVEYVFTLGGPEPIECRQSGIDYERYLQRQMAPVADSILQFVGKSFAQVTDRQMGLF